MIVSDWYYGWFSANIKLNRLGSLSIHSVVAARRTGLMLHRSGIYGRLHTNQLVSSLEDMIKKLKLEFVRRF